MISYKIHNFERQKLKLSPLFRWGNQGCLRSNNFPKSHIQYVIEAGFSYDIQSSFLIPTKPFLLDQRVIHHYLLSLKESRNHTHNELNPQCWYAMTIPDNRQVTRQPCVRWRAWEDEMIERKINQSILPLELCLILFSLALAFSQNEIILLFQNLNRLYVHQKIFPLFQWQQSLLHKDQLCINLMCVLILKDLNFCKWYFHSTLYQCIFSFSIS